MKVRFHSRFDYVPSLERRVTIVFNPLGGDDGAGLYTVKRECGLQAIAEGKAVEINQEQTPEPEQTANDPAPDAPSEPS